MLRFGSGYSGKVNSAAAMEEALLQADAASASVLLIHATVGHNSAPLLATAAAICPGATIVGCTGSGVVYSHGVNESMRALSVMSITGSEVAVSFRDGVTRSNGRDLAAQAARELQGKLGGINAILLYAPS
jgi:small ligand-binding sensory domain FIST